MSNRTWTRYDKVYLGLLSAPFLALLLIFAVAAISGWRQQNQVEAAWSMAIDDVGGNISDVTYANWYDARTSKRHSDDLKILLHASELVIGWLYELEPGEEVLGKLVPPGEDWAAAEVCQHYMKEAEPIIWRLQRISAANTTTWHPIVFQGFDTLLPEVQQNRNLSRLLAIEFRTAFHSGENERAIEALRTLTRLFGPEYKSVCLVEELVRVGSFTTAEELIRESLAFDVWTPEQLDSLMQLISVTFDWNARWLDINRGELLMCYPLIENPAVAAPEQMSSARIAGSELSQLIRHRQTVATIDGAGTQAHVSAVEAADEAFISGATDHWRPDRLLQFPLMQGKWLSNLISPHHGNVANVFARESASQRWTRCAIAIKQFEMEFQRFPKTLSELSNIGFRDFQDHSYGYFVYAADRSSATLEIVLPTAYTSRSDEADRVTIK